MARPLLTAIMAQPTKPFRRDHKEFCGYCGQLQWFFGLLEGEFHCMVCGHGSKTSEPAPESLTHPIRTQARQWWASSSTERRRWVFASIAWPILVLLVVFVFDPAGYHGRGNRYWAYFDGGDVIQLAAICAVPLIAALVRYCYVRLVLKAPSESPAPPPR